MSDLQQISNLNQRDPNFLPYRVGFCTSCDAKIAVGDSDGRINAPKPNYRQIKIYFEDGHYLQVPVCDGCGTNVDIDLILKKITHDGSQAGLNPGKLLKYLQLREQKAVPIRITMPNNIFQGKSSRSKDGNRS